MTVVAQLAEALTLGDRRALSKAITLVESTRAEDRALSCELLARLGAGSQRSSRIGVTGVPGAGKSTLIDALGLQAIAAGRRVAVLAIDPSSPQSGGSVLADKTRMTHLSVDDRAFVRPSPTLGKLGGTAPRTRELIVLCEAAGYDLIFVETVGVGQSEAQVASMVDCLLLVLLAGAGDELSSMKRGLMEVADIIAFNKADGDRIGLVESDAATLRLSLDISRPARAPAVLLVSARNGTGVPELWKTLEQRDCELEREGTRAERRASQLRAWFEAALDEAWHAVFIRRPDLMAARARAAESVASGAASPLAAAQHLVAALLPPSPANS
jgi:LAO/AO transport system kinase